MLRPPLTPFPPHSHSPAWQPLLTPKCIVIMFSVIGIVFVIIGFVLTAANNKVRGAACGGRTPARHTRLNAAVSLPPPPPR